MSLGPPPPPYSLYHVSGVDVRALTESAMKAFQVLEPWMEATSGPETTGLEEFDRLIAGIRAQGRAFVLAIDFSVKTSHYGAELARNLAALQQSLSGSSGVDQAELLEYVRDLKHSVTEARKRSEETLARFQSVRRGLTTLIPLIVDLIMARLLKTHRSHQKHNSASKFAHSAATMFSSTAQLGSSIPVPILNVIIPIVFPVLQWASGKIADIEAWKAKVRRREKITLEKMIPRIEQVDKDLTVLLKQFKPFATWWIGIEADLDSVAQQIKNRPSSPRDIVLITQHQLEAICGSYGDYAFEIGKLMDLHLSPMLQSAGDLLIEDGTLIISLCPSTAAKALSDRVVECQSAFQSLRHIVTNTKERYQRELGTLLDDIWAAMAREFAAHISLLRKFSTQARSTVELNHPDYERTLLDLSDGARASLKRHLATAQLIAELMEQLRELFVDKAPKKGTSRSRLYQKAADVLETPESHSYISGRQKAFSDNSVILERFVVSSNNVGTTCWHLALIDFSGSKINRIQIDAALTAISHIDLKDSLTTL